MFEGRPDIDPSTFIPIVEAASDDQVFTIKITRWGNTPHGVFGHMKVFFKRDVVFECYTVERPWLDNQRNVSCIPAGVYRAKWQDHVKEDGSSYRALEILDVDGRDNIEIHIANTMDDVQGCIGIGDSLGFVKDRWAVTNSTATYEAFLLATGEIRCTVRIMWATQPSNNRGTRINPGMTYVTRKRR